MLHTLLLSLQRSGYVSTVAVGGPEPPAPSAVNPTLSPLNINERASAWSTYHGNIAQSAQKRLSRLQSQPPAEFEDVDEQRQSEEGEEVEQEGDVTSLLRTAARDASLEAKYNGQSSPAITKANVASRRLWVGLKYWNNEPVLRGMKMVSKPTRRVWMGVPELLELTKGNQKGYVKGLRGLGESMFLTTDRGIMEIRECVERKAGGMLLCRVNPF